MKTNKLINEKSPYLLQHAHNPVSWMPWGDEAFEKAKKQDKPIFLSVGYSTCHWCHVMAKESFEDVEMAQKLNDAFVCIKVDREERPDIDSIYMTVCQMLTGSGGWPLSVFMTPDKHAFFAGTYFPKESKWGRQGLMEIADKIDHLWKEQRDKIMASAESISSQLNKEVHTSSNILPNKKIFFEAYRGLAESYDSENGGFGTAPKFPVPSNILFLLRYYQTHDSEPALEIVNNTLYKMRNGGIYDQIGFGFHRYSTDEKWLVPHFEKMLYDQALISQAYIEAYQATKDEFYKQTAEEIFEYILRDMTGENGGFYSAEDADSEGVEGKFYVWTYKEIKEILGDEAPLFCKAFGILKEGNYFENFENEPAGNNILHVFESTEDLSKKHGITNSEVTKRLNKSRELLFNKRNKRIRPGLDDKILTDWNGLMIASLAKAAIIFDNKKYLEAAENAHSFILKNMMDENNTLHHRYRDGDVGIEATLDDYAFFIYGTIELYMATLKSEYLKLSVNLEKTVRELFFDKENGGYFMVPSSRKDLIARKKEVYDGATPSGNSIMLMNLARLWKMTGKNEYFDIAEKTTKAFTNTIEAAPGIFTHFLSALNLLLNDSIEIVVVANTKESHKILYLLNNVYQPNMVIIGKIGGDENIKLLAPFTKDMKALDGKPTIYLCRDFACERPTSDINEVIKKITGTS